MINYTKYLTKYLTKNFTKIFLLLLLVILLLVIFLNNQNKSFKEGISEDIPDTNSGYTNCDILGGPIPSWMGCPKIKPALSNSLVDYSSTASPPPPTAPGCYRLLPEGCTGHGGFDKNIWVIDSNNRPRGKLDKNYCLDSRVKAWNGWCGISDAKTVWNKPLTGYAGDGTGSSASNPRYIKGCCSGRNTSIWQKAFNSKCDLACNFNTAHGGTSTGSGNASSSQCKDGDSIYSNCKGKDPSCVTGREDACKTLATTYFLGESNSNNMASPLTTK